MYPTNTIYPLNTIPSRLLPEISKSNADYATRTRELRGPHRKVDLHCHTTKSDGKKTVAELVADAVEKNLEFVAVTDHDLVNREAKALLENNGIASCESVEISARDYAREHSLHMTFYAQEINARTDAILQGVRDGRVEKVRAQCELLARNGFEISLTDLILFSHSLGMSTDSITNGHIAEFAMQSVQNRKLASKIAGRTISSRIEFIQAFLKDFSEFKEIGYVKVPDYEPSVELVAELVRENRAVVSVAHPNFTFEKYGGIEEFEKRMTVYAKLGITAIEVNPFASWVWIDSIIRTADRVGMILTFGSDSHGEEDARHLGLGQLHRIARMAPQIVQESMERVVETISA